MNEKQIEYTDNSDFVKEDNSFLKSDDIYKDFGLRGYDYSGIFRGIQKVDYKCKTNQFLKLLLIKYFNTLKLCF